MARLMDYLLRSGLAQKDGLEESQMIVIDNASRFWFFSKAGGVGWHLRKDFPNVAPPFSDFYMEFNFPNILGHRNDMYGCRFVSKESKDRGYKWDVEITAYAKEVEVMKVDAIWYTKVKSDGTFATLEDGRTDFKCLCMPSYIEASKTIRTNALLPCFFAISLMHCKNVELNTQVPPAPLSKKSEKEHGRPLVTYKILEIEPMKTVLRTEGKSETLGLKQALHICRGHFKDYSKGGGLFGKYKGLYWWEQSVRGDPSQGVVVKDYSVNPPTDTPT